jgi:hypothetical protein
MIITPATIRLTVRIRAALFTSTRAWSRRAANEFVS